MFVLESKPTSELNLCADLRRLPSRVRNGKSRQCSLPKYDKYFQKKSDMKENIFIQGAGVMNGATFETLSLAVPQKRVVLLEQRSRL